MKKGFVLFTMLLVQFTDFVVNAKGSIAGTTYQKGRYGYVRRAKPLPSNPQTSAQQGRRSIFAALSSAWKTLTDEQRVAWRSLAESINFVPIFGTPKPQTGNTLYIALNSNLATVGEVAIQDAPAPVAVTGIVAPAVLALNDDLVELEILYDATPNNIVPADTALAIFATPSMSPGINAPSKSAFRFIGIQAAATDTSDIEVQDSYLAVFGAPIVGQRIFFRLVLISTETGQAGVPYGIDAIVTA